MKTNQEEQSLLYKLVINGLGWIGIVLFVKYFFIP